ncbi:hypothetical protein [Sphingomonas sp.]|uniref:hypothetical protein n=1 Tax=Sphingomonas sp. TaxID=28214 RepID=UPI0025FE03C0|nr:hypothetical protein [Sphingomonas sp.]
MAALALAMVAPAHAATRAGTAIANTATLTVGNGADRQSLPSNTVTLTTAELLDVTVAADRPTIAATGAEIAVGYVVVNTGNGAEDFVLTIASDRSAVTVARVAIDSDGNGSYDAASDRSLAPGAPLSLTPGQSVRIFVLVDGGQVTAATHISVTATAHTGSGVAGTTFAGAGDQGGDAVVGRTGGTATATTLLTISADQPSLTKSQTVFAPDGSTRAVRGAIVTYTLVASFPTATGGAAIDDPVPAGTTYVPGSITLDGRALSDAADGDAASVDGVTIHVALGDVAAASTRTVQFSVKIQ